MNAVTDYLRFSTACREFLGGVRWSNTDDALVFPGGQTFAFNEQVAQFLVGFSSGGRLIHFDHILHLLDLLGTQRLASTPEIARLRRLFADAGRSLHNAGALCAVLCRDVPAVAAPVTVQDVCDRLRNTSSPLRGYLGLFHVGALMLPPIDPPEFQRRLLTATKAYGDDELLTWFRHGRAPVKAAGEALARELPRPRHLAGVLATLLERPRLAAAAGFVSQLVGALTLPPRRLERQELAVGGYSDVTTHGRLDEILPSQFALDEWDFFRRFAENELLYFRREDPPSRTRQQLVVVFDQGVRTWGDVRLVLSAAVLALGKQAARRGVPFLVAATADDGRLIDPLEADPEELGELLEASDLSAHPGLALERVLEQPADGSRDVVLLTHPRSLAEADVASAARRAAAPAVRLFALTLDASGAAELSELKRGVPVKVREFHVDFTRSAPRPVPPPDEVGARLWRGDVEPVGFPFRFGVSGAVQVGIYCFDYEGQWLLMQGQQGLLYTWKVDGSGAEILPRGFVDGQLLESTVDAIGVAGGFAVVGRDSNRMVVLHYDLGRRTCVAHRLDIWLSEPCLLCYSPEHHAVVLHTRCGDVRQADGYAVDLSTGEGHRSTKDDWQPRGQEGRRSRARDAWQAWLNGELAERSLCVDTRNGASTKLGEACFWTEASELAPPVCRFDFQKGEIDLRGVTPPWQPFTPQADGRPLLKNATIDEAQYHGGTLALLCFHPGWPGLTLRLFRGPEGRFLGEFPVAIQAAHSFVLSDDGKRLARRVRSGKLEIRGVDSPFTAVTQVGGFTEHVELTLLGSLLFIWAGKHHRHTLRWDRDKLEVRHHFLNPRRGGSAPPGADGDETEPTIDDWVQAPPRAVPSFLKYDAHRFRAAVQHDVLAVSDRYGQVAIFDRLQRLVCMFFAFRATLAGWMPDGTRFGPASVTGGPPSAGVMEKFGRALRAACAARSEP